MLLAKWRRLPALEKRLTVQAMPLLLGIWLGLKVFPLNKIQRALDRLAGFYPYRVAPGDGYPESAAWVVGALSRRLFPDRSCLTQALAVQFLYRRAGCPARLCIGVAKEGDRLVAHAWVECGEQVVIGGSAEELSIYTRLPMPEGRPL